MCVVYTFSKLSDDGTNYQVKERRKKFEKDDGRFQLTSQENNTKEKTQKSTQKWHEECFWVYVALFTFVLTKANAQEEIFLCVFFWFRRMRISNEEFFEEKYFVSQSEPQDSWILLIMYHNNFTSFFVNFTLSVF